MDPEVFRNEYWERRPLRIPRNDPRHFAELLTLSDVDALLSRSGPDFSNIRVVSEGQETPVSALGGTDRLEMLYERYRSGSTIVLNALERRWDPLTRLTTRLSAEVGARFQVNAYLTPGGRARGFDPHYDNHDVIILQAHGTKSWRLYGMPDALPLRSQRYGAARPVPEAEEEFDLEPGSVLYLPRGTVHAATSTDTASLHLTLGVHPVLFPALLGEAVQDLAEEDEALRRGLPIGFASDEGRRREAERMIEGLLEAVRTRLTPRELTDRAVRRAVSIAPPVLRGHLTDLERMPGLDGDTPVRLRPDLRWRVSLTHEHVELAFHNKTVRLPRHVADEVRFVLESGHDPFTAASITGDLDRPGRLLLVHTLVREGLLTVG
ncbi:cupin domain-containing protein [Streptomyces sp. NPDC004667]|uniref:cupin domain-containing protein n=1 Tax=Streptomyces sp. NPDC004667 TaxID=3154285 RepID=UPI0033B1EFC0